MARKLTQEEFIRRLKEVSNGKYDFSKTVYRSKREKVIVTCPDHGDQLKRPEVLLRSSFCSECSGRARITVGVFIKRALDLHKGLYDYSLVNNICSSSQKIDIKCRSCKGVFKQSVSKHLSGQGCPLCIGDRISKTKRKSKYEFISDAIKVHGDKYIYPDDMDYLDRITPVKIICKAHGEFVQTPASHVNGRGCTDCGYARVSKINSISQNEFIDKAKAVHGDKYDYSSVKYRGTSANIKIRCTDHDLWFEQTPNRHLNGAGCPACAKEKIGAATRYTLQEFIDKSNNHHGSKYDYSLVEYVNCVTEVDIICHEHGIFSQKPVYHMNGHGYSKCGAQNHSGVYSHKDPIPESEKDVQGILYLVEMTNPKRSFYKIGVTRQESVARRMKKLKQTDCTYREISQVKTNMYDVRSMEREIFAKLEEANLRYKIHDMQGNPNGGWTECFPICQEVDDIIQDFFPINKP